MVNAEDSNFEENLGFEDPIGSTKKISIKKQNLIYLKPGMGVPCAGQVKAILAPRVLVIVWESTLLANFGLVDPIGSNKIQNLSFLKISYVPEAGNWCTLGRTC